MTRAGPVNAVWAGGDRSNDFPLTELGSISTTGYSALRLHISGGQPTGDNYVQMASFDHPTLTQPQLIVTYTIP